MSANTATDNGAVIKIGVDQTPRWPTPEEMILLERFDSLSSADRRAVILFADRLWLRAKYHIDKSHPSS